LHGAGWMPAGCDDAGVLPTVLCRNVDRVRGDAIVPLDRVGLLCRLHVDVHDCVGLQR